MHTNTDDTRLPVFGVIDGLRARNIDVPRHGGGGDAIDGDDDSFSYPNARRSLPTLSRSQSSWRAYFEATCMHVGDFSVTFLKKKVWQAGWYILATS